MKPESLVFGIAGTFLGLIAGWLIGSQQPTTRAATTMAPATTSAPASTSSGPATNKVVLDEAEVKRVKDIAEKDPQNASPRTTLGNMYFDAERYAEAAEWYTKALELDPTNPDVSTDLGVSYYYENQPDKALTQFAHSLQIDPKHTKTMLNRGIVLAFGKQDLAGAAKAWEEIIKLSPDSPEGQAARRALDSLKGAHPNLNGGTAPAPGTN
jgi:tetratricopeptide (TPR) repeat protein